MRGSTFRFITAVTLCAGLFAGCEWTGSDSDSSWSGKYDDMNFSGTYRTTAAVDSVQGERAMVSSSEIVSGDKAVDPIRLSYSGRVRPNVVPGSLVFRAGEVTYRDNGNGGLEIRTSGDFQSGSGVIQYESGAWAFNATSQFQADPIRADYAYYAEVATAEGITSINVTQNGQRLTIMFSNGVTMSGSFTTVNEIGSGAAGTAYNAAFEVSSSGNKLVGTLSSTSGRRVISGTWISGKTYYTINGTAN